MIINLYWWELEIYPYYEIQLFIENRFKRFYGRYRIDKKIIDLFFRTDELGICYTRRWKVVRLIQFLIPDFIKKLLN